MVEKIEDLENFVLLEEENIKKKKTEGVIKKSKTKTQRNKIITVKKKLL